MPISPMNTPFKSPLSDLIGVYSSCQLNTRCRDLELNLVDCLDVYGKKGFFKQCVDEFSDYLECLHNAKSQKRVEAMQQERTRQYLAGERTKKDLYGPSPRLDSYDRTYRREIYS